MAQLVEHRTVMREVAGSNYPDGINTQDLKKAGKVLPNLVESANGYLE